MTADGSAVGLLIITTVCNMGRSNLLYMGSVLRQRGYYRHIRRLRTDVEKFWLVLLFIYDLTMDKTLNLADFRKSQYEVLTDIQSYLANRPNARLYLSDDKDIPKDNRCEITSPMVLGALRRFVQENLTLLEEHPEQKEFRERQL